MPAVLFLTTAFPPAPEVGSLRLAKLATGLLRCGWEPIVVTVAPTAYTPSRDRAGRRILSSDSEQKSLVEKHEVWALNPISLGSHLHLPFRSRRAKGGGGQDREGDGVGGIHSWRAVTTHLITKSMYPDEYALWIRRAVREARVLARAWGAKAIVASFPTAAAVLAGAKLSRETGLPFVADFRDPWFAYGPARGAGPVRSRIETRIRRTVLSTASAAIAVSDRVLQDNLENVPTDHLRSRVIPHGWDRFEASELASRKPRSSGDGVLRIAHGGTLYPEGSDPDSFFSALKSLIENQVIPADKIRVLFFGRVLMDVESMARRYGLGDVIEIGGFVPRKQALNELADADVLLLLRAKGDMTFVSGKIWDYFTVGRPILAVVDEASGAAEVMTHGATGFIAQAGNVIEIEERLREVWTQFNSGMLHSGDYGPPQELSSDVIAGRLAELLDEVSSDR